MRALLPIIMVCLALLSLPAAAQEAAQEAAQTGTSAPSPAPQAVPAIEAGAIERLIETLETPERREQLLTDLRALLAVQAGGAVGSTDPDAAAAQAPAPPAAPKRGGAAIGDQISTAVAQHGDRVEAVFNQVIDAISAAEGLPAWLERQATNPARQAFWIEIATVGLALPILVALLARWLTGAMLGKTIRRLRDGDAPTLQARIFNGAARTTLEAFTVAAVLAAGWAALFLVPRSFAAERIAEVVIQAIAVHTGIGVLARLVLAPYAPHLRPVALPDGMAAYLYIWTLRLSAVGVTGFVISKTAIPLGAGFVGARALEIAAAGVMAGLLLILVTQLRVPVRTALRGAASAGPAGALLRRFADLWNLLASLYVLVGFGIFVSGAQDGFLFLLRATAITLAAIAVAIILQHLANRLLDQLFHVDADLERRFPGLRKRTDLYRPALKRTVDIVLLLLAAIVVFEGWNAGVISALEAETRSAILSSAGTIAAVLLICVAAWEFTASTIARVLQGTNPDGTPREASSRTKTLLPLLRRAILVALVIFGGLIVLSEIGIDIAPLLAGAGVVGLAIGFGSQALVRDVITGLFILIEDTVSVGDVVTAGGHTGVVEDLSIRTIRLRDVEGSVHIVPFGDVTTVVNLTKDFSYALLDIGVAYREDTDRVADLITEVAAEMQADPDWSPKLLDGIEILGVNELADSAVIIRARIKTRPVQQWGVKREMLRRVKKRFDAEGVEIPFPHTTVYFGVDSAGKAPPAHLLLQSEETARRLEEGAPATPPATAAPAAPTS